MIWVFFVLCLITLVIFSIFTMRNFDYWKKRGVKFIKPIPIFGNIFNVCITKASIGEFCKVLYKKTSDAEPYIGFFMLDQPRLLLNDLDVIKNILITDSDNFLNRSMANNEKGDAIGSNMLFLMKTPKWKDIRKRITPAFSPGKLKSMFQLTITSSKQMVDYVDKTVRENDILEARELCGKYTTNSITSAAFGLDANCFEDENAPFRVTARRLYTWKQIYHAMQVTCFFISPKLVSMFNLKFVDDISENFFRQVFWKAVNEREEKKFLRNDIIDLLIEMRKEDKQKVREENSEIFDGDILVAQATQVFIAGFETTSATMSFALFELAKNPEIQKKLREEIKRVKSKYGEISYESINEMEYLENVIYETLRKYPSLPFLDRKCDKTYKVPGSDLVLEEGDVVYIPILGIQYDEKYYPNPNVFDPDRFNQKNSENRHNMTFLSFGDGPRNCIGRRFAMLNAKCGFAHLLHDYEVTFCEKTVTNMSFSQKIILLQPEDGIYLRFNKVTN